MNVVEALENSYDIVKLGETGIKGCPEIAYGVVSYATYGDVIAYKHRHNGKFVAAMIVNQDLHYEMVGNRKLVGLAWDVLHQSI